MTTVDFLGEPLDGNGTRVMTANAKASDVTKRRLRLGMVGGGPGAFIGSVHRLAARMDDQFELVAAALTSDPERSRTVRTEVLRKWRRRKRSGRTGLTPCRS